MRGVPSARTIGDDAVIKSDDKQFSACLRRMTGQRAGTCGNEALSLSVGCVAACSEAQGRHVIQGIAPRDSQAPAQLGVPLDVQSAI